MFSSSLIFFFVNLSSSIESCFLSCKKTWKIISSYDADGGCTCRDDKEEEEEEEEEEDEDDEGEDEKEAWCLMFTLFVCARVIWFELGQGDGEGLAGMMMSSSSSA